MWQRGNGIKIRESRFWLFKICSCRSIRLILDDGLTKLPLCLTALCPTYLIAYNLTIMCFISCTLVQRETFACICWAVAVSLASSAFDSTGGGKPKRCSSDNILANMKMSMSPCIDGVWSICISYRQQVLKTQMSKYRIVVLWWLISKKCRFHMDSYFTFFFL